MGNANETYSAIFDLFTYWGYSMEAEPGKTLGEILQEALDTGNSSEVYYQTLNDAIKRYPELANAEFKSPSWQQGGRYHSETYACVFELPNGDNYIAYRGTDDGGWIDNGQGMTQESTLLQREASDYFDQMAEQYGWTESDNIYVTGHSKGGNKAQYVTLMSNHANLVDECHSFDGQGFSDEAIQSFKEKYGEEGYQEVLKKMFAMDEGASMLGEVALVPKESPINQSGLMFYNTLFDENACCHVAAGRGFSEVIEGFMDMTEEEIHERGINDSMIHMDFMVGSDDLRIVGIREDGSKTDIFVNGTWAE